MSESRAKKARKEAPAPVQPAKKNKGNVLFIIITVVVIAAIVIAGGFAIYGKIKAEQPVEQVQTVADVALEEGLSAEEFLAKIGMDGGEFTGESSANDLLAKMTLENFAKFEDKDVEDFKKEYGIEHLENDMLWNEASMNIKMDKIAELQYEMSFEEFAAQNGFPAEITGDMTQAEAIGVLQSQSAAE